jgi:hypothetical protein
MKWFCRIWVGFVLLLYVGVVIAIFRSASGSTIDRIWKVVADANPFDVYNFIFLALLLSPAIIVFLLMKRVAKS